MTCRRFIVLMSNSVLPLSIRELSRKSLITVNMWSCIHTPGISQCEFSQMFGWMGLLGVWRFSTPLAFIISTHSFISFCRGISWSSWDIASTQFCNHKKWMVNLHSLIWNRGQESSPEMCEYHETLWRESGTWRWEPQWRSSLPASRPLLFSFSPEQSLLLLRWWGNEW